MVKILGFSVKKHRKNIMDFAGAFSKNADEREKIKLGIYED